MMKLIEGAWYERRDGQIRGPAVLHDAGDTEYPWRIGTDSYTERGEFYVSDRQSMSDLMLRVQKPAVVPYRIPFTGAGRYETASGEIVELQADRWTVGNLSVPRIGSVRVDVPVCYTDDGHPVSPSALPEWLAGMCLSRKLDDEPAGEDLLVVIDDSPDEKPAVSDEQADAVIREAVEVTEKQRRVFYQGLLYKVCVWIDKRLGGSTVTGTAEKPDEGDLMERLEQAACIVLNTEGPHESLVIIDEPEKQPQQPRTLEWYEVRGEPRIFMGNTVGGRWTWKRKDGLLVNTDTRIPIRHLPHCTGFDYVPPPEEPPARWFRVTDGEREGWCQSVRTHFNVVWDDGDCTPSIIDLSYKRIRKTDAPNEYSGPVAALMRDREGCAE